MRASFRIFLVSLIAFAAAGLIRRTFFGDVMPLYWDLEQPRSWSLEVAFLLLSIENVGAIMAAVSACFVVAFVLQRHRRL